MPTVPDSNATAYPTTNAGYQSFRYAAFISYRHKRIDRRWAIWLESALENYRVPKRIQKERRAPDKVGRCFRDEDELASSSNLRRDILRALDESRFLIVICSPRTPESNWINAEVQRFRDTGRDDRILALLVEGEPRQSFPPALLEIRRNIADGQQIRHEAIEEVEPLAADVRPNGMDRRSYLRHMASLRLLAPLLGVRFDDLRRREQERRRRRLLYVILMLGLSLLGTLALTAYAFVKRHEANQQRLLAVENQRRAEIRLAEGMLWEANSIAAGGRWVEGRDIYRDALASLARLDQPTLAAEIGIWSTFIFSPPPLLVIGGSTEVRDPGECRCIALAPDGKSALSGGTSGSLHLWDLPTGTEIRKLPGTGRAVVSVDISRDGRLALSGDADGVIRVWDLHTGRELRKLAGHSRSVTSVRFSADGRFILSGGADDTAKLWNLDTGEQVCIYADTFRFSWISAAAISPDGRLVVTGGGGGAFGTSWTAFPDHVLRLWDAQTGKQVRSLAGNASNVTSVAFSPDGQFVLSGGGDYTVRLWQVQSGALLRVMRGHMDTVTSVAFSKTGQFAWSGSADHTIRLWDLGSGREVAELDQQPVPVDEIAVGDDDISILSSGHDGSMRLWRLASTSDVRGIFAHPAGVTSVAISPDNRFALSGGQDGLVKVWDVQSGRELNRLAGHGGAITCVTFSPSGQLALSGSADHTMKLWDLSENRKLVDLVGHDGSVTGCAFSPDGHYIGSCSNDGNVALWKVSDGRRVRLLHGHETPVNAVAFSPDGSQMLSGASRDTAIQFPPRYVSTEILWEVRTGKRIHIDHSGNSEGVLAIAFSPDGHSAISCIANRSVELWDVRTGRWIRSIHGHRGPVRSIAFSPDGRLVIGGDDDALTLWDLRSGRELQSLQGHVGPIKGVAFSSDGRRAISGSDDGMLKIWNFGRASEYMARSAVAADAQRRLMDNPRDGESLAKLGEWYAFRGANDFAILLFDRARAERADIEPITMAQCYLEANRLGAAIREFRRAARAARTASQAVYPTRCISAILPDLPADCVTSLKAGRYLDVGINLQELLRSPQYEQFLRSILTAVFCGSPF